MQPDRSHPGLKRAPLPVTPAEEAAVPATETAGFRDQMVSMNEALLLGSLRQHELTAAADSSNLQLQAEIGERKQAEKALHRAQALLRDRAGQLEGLVLKRTTELMTTNQRLEASVDSIKQGKEEYRLLFLESQVMRGKLSQLTRQILTAQEEERKQISRELHDEVVQTLVGINVELAALGTGNSVGVLHLKKKITHTQRLVENSVHAVHRFARGLRPAVLDDLGLIPALHAYCKTLAEKKQTKIQFTAFGGVEALGNAERTVLFRVAQEALTNVIRHANATEVKLSIIAISNAIRMEIADNGKSFRIGNALVGKNHKRLGLVGMNERVEMVGGTLVIESVSGKGTLVRADIPFHPGKTKK
jgi:two-component system sensor histidine kinase DegS